jgi:hypothetical protein
MEVLAFDLIIERLISIGYPEASLLKVLVQPVSNASILFSGLQIFQVQPCISG